MGDSSMRRSAMPGIPEELAGILDSRGFADDHALAEFLNRTALLSRSPFSLPGMEAAVDRLRRAVDGNERIMIFSDSDLDGLSSLAIMRSLLDRINAPYLHDFTTGDETFGVMPRVVDRAIAEEVRLFITMDCGIRDNDEIARLRERGIDVIVTDHHEPGDALPDAVIVNPKIGEAASPHRPLAGCGVVMIFALAYLYSYLPVYKRSVVLADASGMELFRNMCATGQTVTPDKAGSATVFFREENGVPDSCAGAADIRPLGPVLERAASRFGSVDSAFAAGIRNATGEKALVAASLFGSEKIFLFFRDTAPLAAVGTVADMVPMDGSNRGLVHLGTRFFPLSSLPPAIVLQREFGPDIDAFSISWNIAPLLNSPGRYGETGLAADFLCGDGGDSVFAEIKSINRGRKNDIAATMRRIGSCHVPGLVHIACAYYPDMSDGITGIIAARIADECARPAIAACRTNEGFIKGSGRAPEGYDILAVAESFGSWFLRFGGHPQAFGFSIHEDRFSDFVTAFDQAMGSAPVREAAAGCIALPEHRVLAVAKGLSVLEPFGTGNVSPVFVTDFSGVSAFSFLGEGERNGKFLAGPDRIEAVGWGHGAAMSDAARAGRARIRYTMGFSWFAGRRRLRMSVESVETDR